MSKSQIERLIDSSVRCGKCGAKGVGTCDCWTKKEVTFTVDDLPPGINKLLRMNRFDRRKAAHAWGWKMKAAIESKKGGIAQLTAWNGVKLSISMHVITPQLYDEDNLCSIMKVPLDSMRALGWLLNDSPDCVCFEKPTQEKGKQKKIRFTIRPAQ